MPADPRLDALIQYSTSALGVGATDEIAQLRQRVETLERLVQVLLRTPGIPTIAGTPTSAARDGTPAADTTASKFWLRLGGVWKSVTLT